MSTFDYQPNSHTAKAARQEAATENKRVEKVVKGNVKTKKKSEAAKLGTTLKDGLKDAGAYIVKDVLIPAGKKLFVEMVNSGANILAYGSAKQSTSRSVVDKVSFRKYWDEPGRRTEEPRARSRFDYDEITFDDKNDALAVLDGLDDLIATYGFARVSDLYQLVGKSCEYTCEYYGWDNLASARVVGTSEGYVLDMPRVIPNRR